MNKPVVETARWEEARDNYEGWCTSCQEWTRGETEPDAIEYDCPDCGGETVIGAEEALIEDVIELSDEVVEV